MHTKDIRRGFLDYFKKNQHAIVPSSPVLPHDDPSLLFINAGMNQFKDVFLGKSKRDYTRASTSQKCIRVGGKHNDLENVGHTSRHLTFFEMLGNFSFGDYFKKEAIRFAWEVSTEVFQFDPEFIWPTVYLDDDEAFEIWKGYVPAEKITRLGEKDNYWSMGETGPCGPCSELLYDRGTAFGSARNPAEDIDGERFFEFWNLVFMQFNRHADGSKELLPNPCIDTGAGLERLMSLKIGAQSVFETDVLRELIAATEEVSGKPYHGIHDANAPAFHVIADHLRSLAFAIADGVQPSNVDRGYVLRKVLRRAVRYGRQLGLDRPFLAKIFPRLIAMMGEDYPELKECRLRIEEIVTAEEEAFQRTLQRGGTLLADIIQQAKKEKGIISGDAAFKLKDTYGFPLEEILLIAKDAALTVDIKRYEKLDHEARELSRQSQKKSGEVAEVNLFADYVELKGQDVFTGYSETSSTATVKAILSDGDFVESIHAGQQGVILLNQTPFYAEKGGQVGDKGIIFSDQGHFEVEDTQAPYPGAIAHQGRLTEGVLHVGDQVEAEINAQRRQKIANNHTATHLLHYALQKVLGDHVRQAGSVVDDERLRFDFSHHKALTIEEISEIEAIVNALIRENTSIQRFEMAYDEVQERGDIKQFFGDKYGSRVTVIDIGDSKELCGGTHTAATGKIGYFRISKESSISAGVRRIEAVSGAEAEAYIAQKEELIEQMANALKVKPHLISERVEKLQFENKELAKKLRGFQDKERQHLLNELEKHAEGVGELSFVALSLSLPIKELRGFAEEAIKKLKNGVVVVGTVEGDRCGLLATVSEEAVKTGISARELIQQLAPIVGGSGGGKERLAQAGGTKPESLDQALSKVKSLLMNS